MKQWKNKIKKTRKVSQTLRLFIWDKSPAETSEDVTTEWRLGA